MTITIYGIKNCDTMKRAFAWLDQHGVAYQFHDYKTTGIDTGLLRQWCGEVGWETLLNRRGTTWRKLTAAEQADVDETKAITLMAAYPSLIKRPVLRHPGGLLVAFDASDYQRAL